MLPLLMETFCEIVVAVSPEPDDVVLLLEGEEARMEVILEVDDCCQQPPFSVVVVDCRLAFT